METLIKRQHKFPCNSAITHLTEICLEQIGRVVDDGADPVHAAAAHRALHALLHDEEHVVKHASGLLVGLHGV